MNRLDKALLDHVRKGLVPMVIYMSREVFYEVLMDDQSFYQIDRQNQMYSGIRFYTVSNDIEHIAIY